MTIPAPFCSSPAPTLPPEIKVSSLSLSFSFFQSTTSSRPESSGDQSLLSSLASLSRLNIMRYMCNPKKSQCMLFCQFCPILEYLIRLASHFPLSLHRVFQLVQILLKLCLNTNHTLNINSRSAPFLSFLSQLSVFIFIIPPVAIRPNLQLTFILLRWFDLSSAACVRNQSSCTSVNQDFKSFSTSKR